MDGKAWKYFLVNLFERFWEISEKSEDKKEKNTKYVFGKDGQIYQVLEGTEIDSNVHMECPEMDAYMHGKIQMDGEIRMPNIRMGIYGASSVGNSHSHGGGQFRHVDSGRGRGGNIHMH